uniref:Protein transport protein Sec24A n=1 Tax=Ditylenchus dipsaci TaxID=166011 RepID=A0A915CX28_9BILA
MLPPSFPSYAPPPAPFDGQQQQQPKTTMMMPHQAPPAAFNGYSNGASNGIPQQQPALPVAPRFPVPNNCLTGQNANAQWSNQPPVPPGLSKQPVYNNQPPMQSPPIPAAIPRQQQHQVYNNNVSSPPMPNFQNNLPASSAYVPPNHYQPPLPSVPQQQPNQMPMQQNQMAMSQQQQSSSYQYNNAQQPSFGAPSMQPPSHMLHNSQQVRYMDLMQERNLLGFDLEDNEISLPVSVCNPEVHCAPSVFRCTMSAIPETTELLNKCRLPLGLTLQPFRDLKNLTVIQTNIVRCRYCRTYINPYVYLPDNRHWKCNLCYRVNDLPEEFTWDPVTKSFGDPSRRPELQNATMEYIAPAEYMLRPPQPALYLFIFDVSSNAVDCGYLHNFAEQLLINLDQMPGDERTLISFIGVDSSLHFFQFTNQSAPPKQLVVDDVDEPFAPVNFGLIVELHKYKESVRHFVQSLPTLYESNSNSSYC